MTDWYAWIPDPNKCTPLEALRVVANLIRKSGAGNLAMDREAEASLDEWLDLVIKARSHWDCECGYQNVGPQDPSAD